ncbi:hypothetical protein ACWWJF_20755 [Symbiopectobacterium sp. Eva_TO]
MNALIHGVLSILFKKWPKDVYNDMALPPQMMARGSGVKVNGSSKRRQNAALFGGDIFDKWSSRKPQRK